MMRRNGTRLDFRPAHWIAIAAVACLLARPGWGQQQDDPVPPPPSAQDTKQPQQPRQPQPPAAEHREHSLDRFDQAGKTPDEVTMSHTGEFVRAAENQFTMRSQGREHSHTLSEGSRVTLNGRAARLSDLRPGDQITVTSSKTELGTALTLRATRGAGDPNQNAPNAHAARNQLRQQGEPGQPGFERRDRRPDEQGSQAWLGIMLRDDREQRPGQEPAQQEAPQQGAVIANVYPSGPAARAGLMSGDAIVRIGEHEVKQLDDLYQAMDQLEPNEQVEVTVNRNGEEQKLTATLASREDFFGDQPFRGFRDEFFGGAPEHSMMLEQQRHLATQHQRLEDLLQDVLEEVKQLRREVQELKGGEIRQREDR